MENSIKKLSRICWNSRDWKKPSGYEGKSKNKESYECKHGFGHEEWIFDTNKLIDGYHYAYLQSIRNYNGRNTVYDISLYTIKAESGQKIRYWLGEILQAEIIDAEESRRALKIYKEKGWYDEMKSDLNAVGLISSILDSFAEDTFFVFRFKPENLIMSEPYVFSHTDQAVLSNYYNLLNFRCKPNSHGKEISFEFSAENKNKKNAGHKQVQQSLTDVVYIHNKIQNGLYKLLCSEYGECCVGTENNTGYNSRVDLVVKLLDSSFYFYEIKTGSSMLVCLREALGQVIEYVHFRETPIPVSKMFVVGQYLPNQEEINYIEKLRKKYNIPIYYQHYNLNTDKLSPAY